MVKDNKKKKGVTLSLGEFQEKFGAASASWADDEPDVPFGGSGGGYGGGYDRGYERSYDRGGYDRNNEDRPSSRGGYRSYDNMSMSREIPIPDHPPFKAMIRNMDYKTEQYDVEDFLQGCNIVKFVHLTDRETGRPRGFGYIEFGDRESLVKALTYSGQNLSGRDVRLEVAEQREDRRGGGRDSHYSSESDNTNWRDLAREKEKDQPAFGSRDRFGGGDRYGDRGDRYGDRGGDRYGDRGGDRDRYSQRGGGGGSDWNRGPAGRDSGYGRRDEAPAAARPRLNLQPRTRPVAEPEPAPAAKPVEREERKEEAKPSAPKVPHSDPFGAARPVDTLARELEMEKRIQEKRAQAHAAVEKEELDRRQHRGENRDRPASSHDQPRGEHRGERRDYGGRYGGDRNYGRGYDRQRSDDRRYDDRHREHDDRSRRDYGRDDRYSQRDNSRDRTDRRSPARDPAPAAGRDENREREPVASVANKFAALDVHDDE